MSPYVDKIITYLLTPVKWAYQTGVWFHNRLFDSNLRKQVEFDVPVISVGNLTVGGTGKTPHVEYLVDTFYRDYNIAVISRGYKRKTHGFVLASPTSTPTQIGDEPYQINRKYGDRIKVAVCNNRKYAINNILKLFPETNLIILDDAFQYRRVRPLVNILLLDSNRPIDRDDMLPLGRLREPRHASERADMIIITKCPEVMLPFDYREKSRTINALSFQKIFFSSVNYRDLKPVFPEDAPYSLNLENLSDRDSLLLLTGIANPRGFVRHFRNYNFNVRILRFPDHHDFTKGDLRKIKSYFTSMEGRRKFIVTTEKDAVRLLHNPYFPHRLKQYIFYLPIKVQLHSSINGDIMEEELRRTIDTAINKARN